MKSIVIVDDKENILKVLKVILEQKGYRVDAFQLASVALKHVILHKPDVVISDIRMQEMDGREFFYLLKARGFSVPFIFITAYGTIEDAVSLMKEGAVDYITKPIDYDSLNARIGLLLKKHEQINYQSFSDRKVLIGSSTVMKDIYNRIKTVAGTTSTVLIQGESGTGKELVARAIHRGSGRKNKPFIAVNCSAFHENLLESELFGHEKGAFTDAVRTKSGIFEDADGGTLFLDKVSELAPPTQAKLLRVLQEKVFTRLGGNELHRTDVRVITATNRLLEEMVRRKDFRQDLYYRLNVIPLSIPPLREHREDIPELVEHFVIDICEREGLRVPEIEPSFLSLLMEHEWPGNIRELENIIERILIINNPERLESRYLKHEPEFSGIPRESTEDVRTGIVETLRRNGGNKSETCKVLGISRRNLYYKIERYGIQPEEYESC